MQNSLKKKSVRYKTGDIFAIPLGDDCGYGYCRHLSGALTEFFKTQSKNQLNADDVKDWSVLFTVWVMDKPFRSASWPKIGNREVEELSPPIFFKQDSISKRLSLYQDGRETPATLEDCQGLENAAIWSANHIEDRLRDHFAGRPNKWVESLKPKGFS